MPRSRQNRFCIVVDTREQAPYTFKSVEPSPEVIAGTLRTGDYSLVGYEDQVVVERKSLIDAFGSFGRGRQRFEKALQRMAEMKFAAVVIESDWLHILRHPPSRSKLNPRTVYASIIAWQQRYGVHFWPCVNRAFAEKTTYRILERFHKDNEEAD